MKTIMKNRAGILILAAIALTALFACQKEEDEPITVTDLEGNSYKAIHIGNQVWMTENLHVGYLRDGTPILGNLKLDYEWQSAAANPVMPFIPIT